MNYTEEVGKVLIQVPYASGEEKKLLLQLVDTYIKLAKLTEERSENIKWNGWKPTQKKEKKR